MLPDTFFSFLPSQASYLNLTWSLIVHTPDDPTLLHRSPTPICLPSICNWVGRQVKSEIYTNNQQPYLLQVLGHYSYILYSILLRWLHGNTVT